MIRGMKSMMYMKDLTCRTMHVWKNYLVMVAVYHRIIVILDPKSGRIIRCHKIDQVEKRSGSFVTSVLEGDILSLFPYNADKIICIDLDSGVQSVIDDQRINTPGINGHRYGLSFTMGDTKWVIGEQEKKIIALKEGLANALDTVCDYRGDYFWATEYMIREGRAYVPCKNANKLLIIDNHNKSFRIADIIASTDCLGFADIQCEEDGTVYLIDNNSRPYVMEEKGEEQKVLPTNRFLSSNAYEIWKRVSFGDRIIRFAARSNKAYVYDEGREIDILNCFDDENLESGQLDLFQGICSNQSSCFFQDREGFLYHLDMNLLQIKPILVRKDCAYTHWRKLVLEESIRDGLCYEKDGNDLELLLEQIITDD